MKKSRTVASLVLNILALLPLVFVLVSVLLSPLGLEWLPAFWPGTSVLFQRRYLLYVFAYVASGFLGLALVGRIILDICQLAKPTIQGKFWAFFKDAATVGALAAVIFTIVMDICYDTPITTIDWSEPLNNVWMILGIAPGLALISGLFTEFDHKTHFLITVLLPFVVYVYVIMNAVFGAINWGGAHGFHGYQIFDPSVTPIWQVALISAAIAAGGYIVGVLYWLIQAGLRKASAPKPGLVVEEVKSVETPEEKAEEPVPSEPLEEKGEDEVPEEKETAGETPAPEPEPEPEPVEERPKVIIVKKAPKELADAYREEPMPRRAATLVSVRAARKPGSGTMSAAGTDEKPVEEAAPAKETEIETAPTTAAPTETKPATATYNNRPRVYHVSRQADSGKWQVKLATGVKAIRLFDTQEEAILYAKGLVKTMGGSIRVHSMKGKMRKH